MAGFASSKSMKVEGSFLLVPPPPVPTSPGVWVRGSGGKRVAFYTETSVFLWIELLSSFHAALLAWSGDRSSPTG